ncbi:CPBP family intramembrane glutamic endopeptidase [Candidatus Omnitrophota bacterium]
MEKMQTDNGNGKSSLVQIWSFLFFALLISIFMNWLRVVRHSEGWILLASLSVGMLAFFYQIFINKKPPIELYSKSYPYRKLKPYGVLSTFILFEFILIWGLYSKQIVLIGEDLMIVTLILVGAIAYYHLFVRMKISLRFLFLAISIPLLAAGTALGLGSYFNILDFILPAKRVGEIVFLNTIYWALSFIFIQVLCEEPAFRGFIMQKLLPKGEGPAIFYSSIAFAIWRMSFSLTATTGIFEIAVVFLGNFIMGAIFALLFIKSRNLLVPIICHGLIYGLERSFFAMSAHPGIRQYIEFANPDTDMQLKLLWFGCLLVGLIILSFIPRKKLNVN